MVMRFFRNRNATTATGNNRTLNGQATLKEFGKRVDDDYPCLQRLDISVYDDHVGEDDDDLHSVAPSMISSSDSSSTASSSPPSSPHSYGNNSEWKEFGPQISTTTIASQDDCLPTSLDHMQDVFVAEALERKRLKNSLLGKKNRFSGNLTFLSLPSLPWNNNDDTNNTIVSVSSDDSIGSYNAFNQAREEYLESKAEFLTKRFDSSVMLTL